MKTIYLRDECKKGERRSPLTPNGAKVLIEHGVKVFIEKSTTRIFSDQSYQDVGAEITSTPWQQMPTDTLILALKEISISDDAIAHTHIYFAHAFKGQDEAKQILRRFKAGGGEILDLEFLTDHNNCRVAAFGYWAGYVGAGLGLLGLAHYSQSSNSENTFPAISPFAGKANFIETIQQKLSTSVNTLNVMVMGSLGRCGSGATDLLKAVGITHLTLWDKKEYDLASKPISEILAQDMFVNCVYLRGDIPPMIDKTLLADNKKLKIISDVSCDPNSSNNPIPVYDSITYMTAPFVQAKYSEAYPVHVQAIDHLPTLLPKESSEEFAEQLFPHILQLCSEEQISPVWQKASDLYKKISAEVVGK